MLYNRIVKHEREHVVVGAHKCGGFHIEQSSLRMPELTWLSVGFVFFSTLARHDPGMADHNDSDLLRCYSG